MLPSGKLTKKITIEKRVAASPARDDLGQPLYVWETLASVWAKPEPISGREFWAQQQIQSEITFRWRIRYRSDVLSGMRIVYNSKYYYIGPVIDPDEKHEELHLMCAEGVIDG